MKKITLDEFCNLKFISNLQFSPNGKHLCFTASQADKAGNCYVSNIYELRGKRTIQLSSGGKERSFQFLDDDTILFAGDRDEGEKKASLETKFYTLPLNGGEARKAFSFPLPVQSILPLKGGDFVVTASVFPGFEDLYKGDKKRLAEYQARVEEEQDYEVVDQVPWWHNGGTFTRSAYSMLFYFSPKKKKIVPLTRVNTSVSGAKLNKDKSEVWFFLSEVKPMMPADEGIALSRIVLPEGEIETLYVNNEKLSIDSFRFGDSFVLVYGNDKKYGINTDGNFYKMSYDTHKLRKIKEFRQSLGSSVGSDVRYGGGETFVMEGDTAYFISTSFDGGYLYKLEGSKITRLNDKDGSVDSLAVCGDKIRCVALYDMKPQEIYDENAVQLTRLNEKALAGKYVAQAEKLNFTTAGHEVHGFVLKPIDYEPGKKYPVVLDIHGGPKTVFGPVFYHEMQYWASLGYFVIYCNPTGSDGRGEFSDIRGKYGTVDYDDIMAFCDAALEAYPDMDAANFFETGGSYGGYMTNWIIGHTDRFTACASQRSISNWLSFNGISDIGLWFGKDQCAADDWSDPEGMWWHSPLKYADKAKTPTLFIHSFEDYRCPIDQGYQMFTALVNFGVETKMVLFKGENHELSRSGKPTHRIRRLNEITQWFEIHKK